MLAGVMKTALQSKKAQTTWSELSDLSFLVISASSAFFFVPSAPTFPSHHERSHNDAHSFSLADLMNGGNSGDDENFDPLTEKKVNNRGDAASARCNQAGKT